jgi:hypothetical protein
MGSLEGFHLLGTGEAMVLKGDVPFLQQPHRPQTPGAGVVRQIHPVKPDGMKSGGGHGSRKQRGIAPVSCL